MKYTILPVLSILFSMLFTTSCQDWLDVKSEGSPNEGSFWKTDKDAMDAINGIYWDMKTETLFGRDLFYEQAGADDFIFGRNRGAGQTNLANFTLDGREAPLTASWEIFYKIMARANWAIYNLTKTASTPIQNRSLGEAYFMRAFAHFYIAYRYGLPSQGVPFERYEDFDSYITRIPPQRATVFENYQLLIDDLNKATEYLPFFEEYGDADYGRAHKAAAWGLMVKVYAYWGQYDNSKWALIPPLVDKMENEGKRGLLDSYSKVFTIAEEWSKEYLWSINSSGSKYAGSEFPGVVLENKGWGRYNGWGYFKPTLGLFNEFAANDTRRGVTILAYGDEFVFFGETRKFYSTSDLEAGFQLGKYMEPFTYGKIEGSTGVSDKVSSNGDYPTTDLNLPILRHGEMVLFKAEALIHEGKGQDAAKELNKLTRRAGLGEVYTTATMENLMHERRCELAGEFTDRLFDLKRWGRTDILGKAKVGRHYEDRSKWDSSWTPVEIWPAVTYEPQKHIVFPYNPDEITKSQGAMKQNPNY